MYNKEKNHLKSDTIEIDAFIERGDIFNSKFLYILKYLPSQGDYLVNLNRYRIDLISDDIYGDSSFSELILLYNGVTISQLEPGLILKSPKLSDVNNLISKLSIISNVKEYISSISEK